MGTRKTTLFNMLAEDSSSKFLREFYQRTAVIYKEAESRSWGDNAIHDDLKPYYCGQARFALHQSMFLRLASECGMKFEVYKCPENGFPIVMVKAGRFFFTAHYATSPDDSKCLDPSLVRQQSAMINQSLVQGDLFKPTFDAGKLRGAKSESIYANLLHGCRGVGTDFSVAGWVRIAFPHVTNPTASSDAQMNLVFVENHNLRDVLSAVVEREKQEGSTRPRIDIAAPKIKKRTENAD